MAETFRSLCYSQWDAATAVENKERITYPMWTLLRQKSGRKAKTASFSVHETDTRRPANG